MKSGVLYYAIIIVLVLAPSIPSYAGVELVVPVVQSNLGPVSGNGHTWWGNVADTTGLGYPSFHDKLANQGLVKIVPTQVEMNAMRDDLKKQFEGELTNLETKLRQESIEAVNKIPDKLISGELGKKVEDEILATIRAEMQQLKSDILSEVDAKIAAQSGH